MDSKPLQNIAADPIIAYYNARIALPRISKNFLSRAQTSCLDSNKNLRVKQEKNLTLA